MTYTYIHSLRVQNRAKNKIEKPLYKTRHGGLIKGIIGMRKYKTSLVNTPDLINDETNFSPFN